MSGPVVAGEARRPRLRELDPVLLLRAQQPGRAPGQPGIRVREPDSDADVGRRDPADCLGAAHTRRRPEPLFVQPACRRAAESRDARAGGVAAQPGGWRRRLSRVRFLHARTAHERSRGATVRDRRAAERRPGARADRTGRRHGSHLVGWRAPEPIRRRAYAARRRRFRGREHDDAVCVRGPRRRARQRAGGAHLGLHRPGRRIALAPAVVRGIRG